MIFSDKKENGFYMESLGVDVNILKEEMGDFYHSETEFVGREICNGICPDEVGARVLSFSEDRRSFVCRLVKPYKVK